MSIDRSIDPRSVDPIIVGTSETAGGRMPPRHLVISADGHAGPPAEVYRDYLDPGFRERFDEHQQELSELRAAMGRDRTAAFRAEWEEETDGDGGLDRRVRLRHPQRHPRRRGRGRRGAVPRRRRARHRPHRRPRRSAPAWPATTATPRQAVAGSRAHNRWLADFVAQEPHRRIGVAVIPAIIPDMDTVLDLVPRGQGARALRASSSPPAGSTGPAYHDPHLRTAVGADRGARPGAAHALRCRADRHRAGTGHAADLRLARPAGGPPVRWPC